MTCRHKFKPRYTEIYSSVIEELSKSGMTSVEHMPCTSTNRSIKEKRYIHDVCVKCGTIAKG